VVAALVWPAVVLSAPARELKPTALEQVVPVARTERLGHLNAHSDGVVLVAAKGLVRRRTEPEAKARVMPHLALLAVPAVVRAQEVTADSKVPWRWAQAQLQVRASRNGASRSPPRFRVRRSRLSRLPPAACSCVRRAS
jgi:hypothetical protein